jgi:ABC-type Na+ transport system ATPase subunit NatA
VLGDAEALCDRVVLLHRGGCSTRARSPRCAPAPAPGP